MAAEKKAQNEIPTGPSMWLGIGMLLVLATVAIASYAVSDEAQADGGSPLYDFAVRDAIQGLRGKAAKGAGVQGQGQVCPNCGKVHPPAQQPNAAQPGAVPLAAHPPVAEGEVCPNCGEIHPPASQSNLAQPGAVPVEAQNPGASPGGSTLQGSDYYYCEDCKSYHRREAGGVNPQGALQSPVITPPLLPPGAPDNVVPAPSPALGPASNKESENAVVAP